MIIDVFVLEHMLHADLKQANKEIDLVTQQESALSSALTRLDGIGSARTIDSLKNYFLLLRLPATTLLRDYLSSYICDMHKDQRYIALALGPLGKLINTNLIQSVIHERYWRASRFESMAETAECIPELASFFLAQAQSLRRQAREIQELLDKARSYINDTSIYNNTEAMIGRLSASKSALGAVNIQTRAGTVVFDISKANLSWVTKSDNAYWKKRNRQTLERYFMLDGSGNPIAPRPEMASRYKELTGIALSCLKDSGMPQEIDRLTDDEKYVLLWLLARSGPPVLKLGSKAVAKGNKEWYSRFDQSVADSGIDFYGEHKEPLLGFIKGILSFDSDGELFYSVDSKNSVQQRNGFSDVVELGGPLLGMNLDTTITTFVHEGYEYRLQTWDGSYGFGAAYGGEIGLYRRKLEPDSPEYIHMSAEYIAENLDSLTKDEVRSAFIAYETVPDEVQPDIRVSVYSDADSKKPIEHMESNTYWLFIAKDTPLDSLGNLKGGYQRHNLYVEGNLTLSDNPELLDAMEVALQAESNDKGIQITRDENSPSIHISWRK